jgi:HlyD family secretion protein
MKRLASVVLPGAALVLLLTLLPGWMRPALHASRIRTAVVHAGPIEAVITASGTVTPEFERVLPSAVDARLLRVLVRPGASVRAGDPIVDLDLNETRLALERIVTDVRIADNQQAQAQLALERALADLDARIERRSLDLALARERAESSRRLAEEGLVSQQTLREAALAVGQAEIDLAQLRRERAGAERSTRLQAEELRLRRAALDRQEAEARRVLELATTRSDRDGVLTWVLAQEGALVRRGDVIARIADLGSFRVEAQASDVHSGRVAAVTRVRVVVHDAVLNGAIADVQPSVDDGAIGFTVSLDEPSHPLLRPNQRVEVLVVTGSRLETLKVRRGPFADGAAADGTTEAFVVRDGGAVRTPVRLGLRGFDEIEILSGVVEGDEIVISDMRDYLHLEEVGIR